MKVIDPGHEYDLDWLDGTPFTDRVPESRLIFVKREGDKYPGNKGHHPGTNIQEVLRVLIDRIEYLNNQNYHETNSHVIQNLRAAIYWLEYRAAERHYRQIDFIAKFGEEDCIELAKTCPKCGHIGCSGNCH